MLTGKMKEFELTLSPDERPTREMIISAAAAAMHVPCSSVGEYDILRRSLDARGGIRYRYLIRAFKAGEPATGRYALPPYRHADSSSPAVIVIGAGPAGMFAALRLLRYGIKPVMLERGKDVHKRKFDIGALSAKGILNPESNFCFGEGGAGTFSDGKLFTRSSKRGDIREVLAQLVNFGADPSIMYEAHPHIGSDRLPSIVEKIRNTITGFGGEYHFGAKVIDLRPSGGRPGHGRQEGNGTEWEAECSDGRVFRGSDVILATGHSARDIYEMFDRKGWKLEAKGFALGVRAEHPQALIDKIQYKGKFEGILPPAEYSLVTQIDGRGVFSFCMCPGGLLVPSSTGENETVLNGMSNSKRNSQWANSGIVVSVNPEDVPEYGKYGVFSVLEFQKAAEQAAFTAVNRMRAATGKTGNPFAAPAQRMTDFVKGITSSSLPSSSYKPGTVSLPLHEILPAIVSSRMRKAFSEFDRKMHGFFTREALLLGVESRTSSPVRIPRDPSTLQHAGNEGLYPCGEGAGYSGGIVSSAIDGIRAAQAIAEKRGLEK